MIDRAKQWARGIKRDILAVWIAARDPRTPWYVKVLAAAVAGYALSPIDLIPDFIPVLGYLFRDNQRTNDRTELMVFITPRVVTDTTAAR